MANPSKINPAKIATIIITRYHIVLFVTVVACFLAYVVYSVTNILTPPTDTLNTSASNFDQATINRLSQYDISTVNVNYQNLPSGRIDPFSE